MLGTMAVQQPFEPSCLTAGYLHLNLPGADDAGFDSFVGYADKQRVGNTHLGRCSLVQGDPLPGSI